jgi:recombination protein RecA
MERAMTKSFIQCFPAVDPSKVLWIEPNHGQDAFNAIETILKVQKNCLIVLDSVPACITSAQLEEGAETEFYAPIPKLLNTFMPKAKTYCRRNNSVLILLNQLRDNMDRANKYSPKDRVPGGRAIKFFCDWRISLKAKDKIKDGDERMGHMVQAMVVKNRANRPYQSATFPLIYGHGFNCGLELLELCIQLAIIKRSGAWYEYKDQRFQGANKMALWIDSDTKVQEELKTKILEVVR